MTEEQGEGWLPRTAAELFGPEAVAKEAYGVLTVDVPAASWTTALRTARDELGCTFFDWLSAVDEPAEGFRVAAHVVAVGTPPRRLLLRTTVPHSAPALATATDVYAGAAWHERETHEMFGVDFPGHPHLARLLLPEEFEGHPLRKDFVLAARVAKAWPGAKEPGESHAGGPKRRQMQPPGVPDPNDWGPLKGTLPPAPTRPTRRGAARADSPPRRSRTSTAGSVSQRAADAGPAPEDEGPVARRGETHDGAEGDAGAPDEAGAARAPRAARRARSASGGSASQRAAGGGPAAAGGEPRPRTRTPDAPWQHPRPDTEPTPPEPPAPGEPAAEEAPPPEAAAGEAPTPRPAAGETDSSPEPAAGDAPPSEPAAGRTTAPRPAAGETDSPGEPAAGDAPPPEPAAGEDGEAS
ncbi:NADH-quinone oxidoreductase subunit C [Streptomyces sp. MAR4 CNY-716]